MDKTHLIPKAVNGHDETDRSDETSQSSFSMDRNSRPASAAGDVKKTNSAHHQPRKLVLCFDGTGNKFKGDDSDSNILKIFRMLDRTANDQYHYYQPGIGTYVVSSSLDHTGLLTRMRYWYMKAMDSAVGTSFAQHVIGGYRFLMRFYSPGDEIYIFGFSRGAYTARFLAEMLDYVGLLSHGNEEMVYFAWKVFSQWQLRRRATGGAAHEGKRQEMYEYMKGFRETFSRPVRRIRFLGLFDTVNSVPRFETAWMSRSKFPYTARTTAKVVRHAVSIDERRAKFRQDLMYQREQIASSSKGKILADHLFHRHPNAKGNAPPAYRPGQKNACSANSKARKAGRQQPRGRGAMLQVPGATSTSRGTDDNMHAELFRASRASRSNTRSRSRSPTSKHSGVISDAQSGLSQEPPSHCDSEFSDEDEVPQDIDEVWFAGGHGDVGGGWKVEPGTKSASHVPLAWMVREATRAGLVFDPVKVREMGCVESFDNDDDDDDDDDDDNDDAHGQTAQLGIPDIMVRSPSGNTPTMFGQANGSNMTSANATTTSATDQNYYRPQQPVSAFQAMMHKAHLARIHDSLMYDCGMGVVSVASWRLMEYLPFRRMDLQPDGSWKPIRWPLPRGEVRDIPDNVRVHGSVIRRLQNDETYRPGNLIVGGGGRGVRVAPKEYGIGNWVCVAEEGDPIGEVWMKRPSGEAGTSS